MPPLMLRFAARIQRGAFGISLGCNSSSVVGWRLQRIEAMPANNLSLVFGMDDSAFSNANEGCEDSAT